MILRFAAVSRESLVDDFGTRERLIQQMIAVEQITVGEASTSLALNAELNELGRKGVQLILI